MVFGFNLLFQNQFGGGGNNQTADLFIDLTDAMKDSTLSNGSINEFENVKIVTNNKQFHVLGLNKEVSLEVYNMLGQNVYNRESIFVSDNQIIELNNVNTGMYLLRIGHNGTTKTFKILLD
jgi:hypothetical protein